MAAAGLIISTAHLVHVLQVDTFSLPAEPVAPQAWFTLAGVNALTNRITSPVYSGYYNSFKSFVDARLAALAGQDDDTLSKMAKAGPLLHRLGATPPAVYPS